MIKPKVNVYDLSSVAKYMKYLEKMRAIKIILK
jgi:hypothetical protein